MFGEWITEEILYPLPHRQYVFTVPKMLRPHFRFDITLPYRILSAPKGAVAGKTIPPAGLEAPKRELPGGH